MLSSRSQGDTEKMEEERNTRESGFDLRIIWDEAEENFAASKKGSACKLGAAPVNFVTPGTIITQEQGFMR